MVSINDVYNQITLINTNLQQINTNLQQIQNEDSNLTTATEAIRNSVDQVNNTLNAGFVNISQGLKNIITLQNFTNQALFHLSEQNETIICTLENISKQTCELLSEAHIQTGLQKPIKESIVTLLELYKSAHPDASLEFERLKKLHKQISECCPPKEPEPLCTYGPCATPGRLNKPPRPEYEVFQPIPQPDIK